MNDAVLTYKWHGVPIRVETYDATNGAWDVSAIHPEHPLGEVPEGEVHHVCWWVGDTHANGFWIDDAMLQENAEPLGPGALRREGVIDSEHGIGGDA